MDGFRKTETLQNALQSLKMLLAKKKRFDRIKAAMSPERRLCEDEFMKQREYAVVDDTAEGWLKTIEILFERWARFEKLSKDDGSYRELVKRIKDSNLNREDVNFLRRQLMKNVEVPPEFIYRGGGMISFICPRCLEYTLLTEGNEFHHCSKCGQKIRQYPSEGFWGNVSVKKVEEYRDVCKEAVRSLSPISDHYIIGNVYRLSIKQLQEINGFMREVETIKDCVLVGKYTNHALFEYQTISGESVRVSLRWLDIKEVQ